MDVTKIRADFPILSRTVRARIGNSPRSAVSS